MNHLAPAVDAMSEDYTYITDSLEGHCPIQGTGTVQGRGWYFRARGEHWSLRIWHDKEFEGSVFSVEASWGDPYAAGWMSQEHARLLIEVAMQTYFTSLRTEQEMFSEKLEA